MAWRLGRALWFVIGPDDFFRGERIGRLDPAGHMRVFTVQPRASQFPWGPASLTVGPDNAAYFIQRLPPRSGPSLVRLGPGGRLTRTALPVSLLNAPRNDTVVAEPHGPLWVLATSDDFHTGPLLRVALNGQVTGSFSGGSGELLLGPDGAIWTWDNAALRRTDPVSLVTTQVAALNNDQRGHVTAVAAGPDGNVWIARTGAGGSGRLDRVTPAGAQLPPIIVPAVPRTRGGDPPLTRRSTVTSIVAGPDGNMWFADGSRIGRVTPAGGISLFPFSARGLRSTPAVAGSVAVAPGNTIAFTVGPFPQSTRMVGRMSLSGQVLFETLTPRVKPTPAELRRCGRRCSPSTTIG
jgi:streptogramin lyase